MTKMKAMGIDQKEASSTSSTGFSHKELSLLLFALEGKDQQSPQQSTHPDPSCESACPVVDHFEALFPDGNVPKEIRLARHLANHLREGLIETGMFEFMANHQSTSNPLTGVEQEALAEINNRLVEWRCEIKLDSEDRQLLNRSMSRLPRSAWLTMPRTLWRLKKKLRSTPGVYSSK